ncbi:hypothetical protein PSI9734_01490 [Pseudidiomarina piscicola]|uniref:DUF885 domain-containing protein n=1 Tax=Pseudidiomarina piscicola TaxID=2614830 RepID=A0A6S6WMN0_9GAMM|nr:DUF885 domain-containing protein [Pseudidiomarina piscicola]CAB0151075.1 hypothetical protein PSI9734_01490 [Pseudidiomarina piscicola]VZT40583.1 hypothetical protein PSI9734_01490 [Pseudomonas aeruginosa]
MGLSQRFTTTLVAASLAMVLGGCSTTTSSPAADSTAVTKVAATEDQRFTDLAEQVWQGMQNPVGSENSDSALPSMTPEAVAARAEQQRNWLNQLMAINTDALSRQEYINWRMLTYRLQNNVDAFDFKEHYMPLNAEGGFHSSLSFMVRNTSLRSYEDYQNYVAKLATVPRYMKEQTQWLQRGMAEGYTQPQASMVGFEDSIAAFIVQSPQNSVFYAPLQQQPNFVTDSQWAELQAEAARIIDAQVIPAYQAYFDFMVMEYLPNSRKSIGASNLPNGDAYYQNRIEHFTTLALSPEEIHQRGLAEVARIRNEMDRVIAQTGFTGSFDEFVEFLRSDPQFYPTSAEELLKEAAYIAKRMDGELPKFFKHLPRQPYGVAPVPAEIAPKYTTGRYAGTSRDDRASFYWVNTYALDRRPLYQLEALTLHEAVPGHHLQGALAREMEGVPSYRQHTYISAFGEGWGLYSEWLGLEAGFYQDPYSNFGRLSYEMWRAARLVVDTGMHSMGWSREKAMDFMASNTALSLHNVRTEIDRYITWPGQALSYKLGEMLIRSLRIEAEETLGAEFDLREFHHQVLKNGSIPLDVLETEIRNWIDSQV